ncbi:MAG: hypothetical protein EAZ08_08510 [Cytophagales bacterium]|nr:MAG: hypothetical protein EAZ08_08510 [Cytophagales bacterium]
MPIQNQVITLTQAEQTLEKQLLSSAKTLTLTVGDVSALTGLNTDDAKHALDVLMAKYICRLKVTEAGDLIYDFGSSMLRRGEKTAKEYLEDLKNILWQVFKIFFKAWIAVTLVFYFIVFLVVIIGLIIAALSGDGDGDFDIGDIFVGFFHALAEVFRGIFIWDTFSPIVYYETDKQGYQYKHYESRKSSLGKFGKANKEIKEEKKSFVASVYDFVFGPPRVETTTLDNLKELAAYSRRQNGIVVTPEVIGLAGYKADDADKFMAEAISHFGGKADVTENGVLYAEFEELSRSASKEVEDKVVWFWDEYEPEYEVTGNTGGRNTRIIGINIFNMIVSGIVIGTASGDPTVSAWFSVGLGWIPFAFSTLFFGVPALRSLSIFPKQKKRYFANIRKRLMKVIYQDRDKIVSAEELMQAVNAQSKGEKNLSKEEIEKVMNDLIFDFQGEMLVKEDGKIVYTFEKLKAELDEAHRLRQEKGFGNAPSAIVFDSGI